jgi:hypothetical protein
MTHIMVRWKVLRLIIEDIMLSDIIFEIWDLLTSKTFSKLGTTLYFL